MHLRRIGIIARQELVISVRNRWTLVFAIIFGVLVLGISYFGLMAEGYSGMQGFTRTSISVLNLVLLIVPLAALIMGTLSFTGDKGSLELIFAQPIARTDVFLGKTVGLFASLGLSTMFGFLCAGLAVVLTNGIEGLLRYLWLVVLSLVLALVFLGLAVLSSMLSHRKAKAFGLSLALWFFFVVLYDLIVMGAALFLQGPAANTMLFVSLFGNPVDMVRVATLVSLDSVTVLGASGAALVRFLGGGTAATITLFIALTGWVIAPIAGAAFLGRRQDI